MQIFFYNKNFPLEEFCTYNENKNVIIQIENQIM